MTYKYTKTETVDNTVTTTITIEVESYQELVDITHIMVHKHEASSKPEWFGTPVFLDSDGGFTRQSIMKEPELTEDAYNNSTNDDSLERISRGLRGMFKQ